MINQGRYLLIKITDSYGKLYKQIEEQSLWGLSPAESIQDLASRFCLQPTLGPRGHRESKFLHEIWLSTHRSKYLWGKCKATMGRNSELRSIHQGSSYFISSSSSFFFFCFYSPVWSRLTKRIQNTWSLGPACQWRSWGHRCRREDIEDLSGCEANSCKEVERWWLLPLSFLCQPILSTLSGVITLALPGQPKLCSATLVFPGASHGQCHCFLIWWSSLGMSGAVCARRA